MMRLVDLSNYSRRLSPQQVADLRTAGFYGAIVQAVRPPAGYPEDVAAQQIETLRAGGITYIEGYVYWWFGNAPDYLGPLLDLLRAAGVRRCWLDVEDTRDYPLYQRISEVADALEFIRARGFQTGIYTARWYWTAYMGDTQAFRYEPLWAAQYDGDPAAPVALFGGWDRARIKQYAGDTTVAGIPAVDLDVEVEGLETRELDQGESIALFNDVARNLGAIIADRGNVYRASEIRSGYPAPDGSRVFVFIMPAEAVSPEVGGEGGM